MKCSKCNTVFLNKVYTKYHLQTLVHRNDGIKDRKYQATVNGYGDIVDSLRRWPV